MDAKCSYNSHTNPNYRKLKVTGYAIRVREVIPERLYMTKVGGVVFIIRVERNDDCSMDVIVFVKSEHNIFNEKVWNLSGAEWDEERIYEEVIKSMGINDEIIAKFNTNDDLLNVLTSSRGILDIALMAAFDKIDKNGEWDIF